MLDIDDPLPETNTAAANSSRVPTEDQIATLQDMGFTAGQAKKALRETVSSLNYIQKKFIGQLLTHF